MEVKEKEQRNNVALSQLAEMVDSVIGMGPIISQHLCEKGLSMPHATGSSRMTSHRSESEYSLRHGNSSKGRLTAFECATYSNCFSFHFFISQYRNGHFYLPVRRPLRRRRTTKALKVWVQQLSHWISQARKTIHDRSIKETEIAGNKLLRIDVVSLTIACENKITVRFRKFYVFFRR